MLYLPSMLLQAVVATADPKSHVVSHGIAPIIPSWNIPLPIGDVASSFWFTNHLLMTLVAAGLMLLVFVPIGQRYRAVMAGVPVENSVPRGFASLVEGMMDALRTSVARPVLGADTDRFMPFLWTMFFFVLINNLLGMVPLDPIFKVFFGMSHIGGTATGSVNVTGGLALCAFFMIHFAGVREIFEGLIAGTYGHDHGDRADTHGEPHDAHAAPPGRRVPLPVAAVTAPVIYAWNFAPHVFPVEGRTGRPTAVVRVLMIVAFPVLLGLEYYGFAMLLGQPDPSAIAPAAIWVGAALGLVCALNAGGLHWLDFADAAMWGFLVPLECIGAVVKPFALCMRLFANMIAGHMVLAALLLLLPAFKGLTLGYIGGSLPIAIGCVLLSCLELFVAFLQAYIFMFLTTMFIGAAVHPEH
ncbi:MAG: F0F1 ATP synthase subunit A [Phycisphaerae bacterium]